jgi:hypothetical protein
VLNDAHNNDLSYGPDCFVAHHQQAINFNFILKRDNRILII